MPAPVIEVKIANVTDANKLLAQDNTEWRFQSVVGHGGKDGGPTVEVVLVRYGISSP